MTFGQKLLAKLRHLRRVEKIYDRYCAEGKRLSREEAKSWLESEGWQPRPLANLLRQWGYDEPKT